jgi:hypothetical protein
VSGAGIGGEYNRVHRLGKGSGTGPTTDPKITAISRQIGTDITERLL